jgi:dipeptidyl aminopeptidase/acylaminoacyl peptidase
MRLQTSAVVLILPVACAWAQVPPAWTPETSALVRSVGGVVPSPDGKSAVYIQSGALLLARLDPVRRLELATRESRAASPSFSPDGRFVLFLSNRSGSRNLWRVPLAGGEAEQITNWKGEVGQYMVSRDGKWIAFAGREPREGDPAAAPEWKVASEDLNRANLWLTPAEPAASRQEPRRLLPDSLHVTNFDWSPESRYIAFEHQPGSSEDHWVRAGVSEVDLETGKLRAIAATGAAEGEPRYSPDGRFLSYLRTPNPARWAGAEEIVLFPRDGSAPRAVRDTFDAGPAIAGLIPRKSMGELLGWTADSSRLLFAGPKGTRYILYSVSLDGRTRAVYSPPAGIVRGAILNAAGTHVGFSRESSSEPPEAFLLSLPGRAPVQISEANVNRPLPPLGETRPIRWKSRDGLEIEGLLTLPAGYRSGARYPLVVIVHGGPMGYFNESYIGASGIYPIASFAARGYAVLRPNIRGSGGYGREFRFGNLNDWGGKDYEDMMAGVDHAIAAGIADPERLALMGWSYGGYMTSWAITRTRRFKAAVVGAAPTNLWSFTGTTDIPGFLPDYLSAEAWDKPETYLKHSPMYHVKGVTTPTLILHGEADLRVPVSQAWELYSALKRQGVATELVVYPRMTHGPTARTIELDLMRRHLDWLERYIGKGPY